MKKGCVYSCSLGAHVTAVAATRWFRIPASCQLHIVHNKVKSWDWIGPSMATGTKE